MTIKLRPGRMLGLDGLRALAVLAVVWHHAHHGYEWLPISRNGFLGVDVFFVLSGFLITHLLLKERDDRGSISLVGFYIRRSLRILPVYYLLLAVLAGYFAWAGAGPAAHVFFAELPWHLSFTSNWVQVSSLMFISWSLSTEEQFYLVWPALVVALGRWAILVAIAFLLFNQMINFGVLDEWLARLGLAYGSLNILQITFTPIVLGVLLAFALAHQRIRAALERLPAGAMWACAGGVLWLANVPGDVRGLPRLSFHMATTALIALVVTQPASSVVRALEWRPLVFVGSVSYGVYLFHMLALDMAVRVLKRVVPSGAPPEWVFVGAGALAIGLAAISFKYFETPLIGLKHRLGKPVYPTSDGMSPIR